MRISFILPSFWLSGGTREVIECANGLTKRGHQITLAIPGGTLDAKLQKELDPGVRMLQSKVVRKPDVGLEQMLRLTGRWLEPYRLQTWSSRRILPRQRLDCWLAGFFGEGGWYGSIRTIGRCL